MKRLYLPVLLGCVVLLPGLTAARAEKQPEYTRTRDVIYGKKEGVAFTLDVFTPKKNANGAAVIAVVSGGFFSRHEGINPGFYQELLKRGYTVFAVVHGSQPKFTVPEILENMNRAVRFIRYHAREYKIDPERIGVTGASAGGHLSLMLGTAGKAGNPKATDPVDRVSSRVQAVACFFPPTDFMNFGSPGTEHIGDAVALPFRAAFDYHEFDKEAGRFERITDKEKIREITRQISPATHVSAASAPTLMIHGDKDGLVPIQQSEWILAKFKKAGVPARLVVKKGADHGWPDLLDDMTTITDWFDKYLVKAAKAEENGEKAREK
ncbi:MAG TPA: alpha/beta hydrolase [Gemmataceae bacterium]|nr:alpha/beta hydrolase [Gemmataceae bacterium]